ncbi:uncharacterized protein ABDE67_020769 [Symphorus nematophorus]
MIWILLFVGFTSSVCGMFVVKMTPTFYRAEEDDNVTIRWDSHTETDMSLTNLVCFLQSKLVKVLYEMVNSVEVPESQHQQFAGRVQCDKDALREGRIRLHLIRVTIDDSGNYRCDLAANYDKTRRGWMLESTEQFVLNVTSHGENRDVLTTPKLTEGAEQTPGGPNKEVRSYDLKKVQMLHGAASGGVLLIGSLILVFAAAVRCLSFFCRDENQDRRSFIELLTNINTKREFIV